MATRFFPLFGSTPAEFPSDFPLDESVERLRAVVKRSIFQTIFEEAAVGKVRQDRVSIWWNTPMVGNSYRQFFIGRFQEKSGQVVLIGAFTMHFLVKAFMVIWFGSLGFFAAVIATGLFNGNAANAALGLLFILGFLAFALGMLRLTKWLSRNDAPRLAAVIRDALSKATDCPAPLVAPANRAGAMGRPPVSMVVLKILVALSLMGCLLSAATGIASIQTGPGGNLIVTEHTELSRGLTVVAALIAAIFLYGLITRAPITWKAGWVLLVSSALGTLENGLVKILGIPGLNPWVLGVFWTVGITLTLLYWGYWWWKQRDYFSPISSDQ